MIPLSMMSNCNRLPGFSHFESSLSNSLCGFEGLDIRFVTDEVGLPPPYPGPNSGLDLSSVNGLDLSSPAHYEGLNLSLTQSCGNNNRQPQHSHSHNNVAQGSHQLHNKSTHQQQSYPTQQQSEMVLNLSTQMGLNLSRTGPTPDYTSMYGNFNYYTDTSSGNNGGYYDTNSTYNNTTAAALCTQMEEQRCSPLNLEHRSSPLNLTSVSNIQRKRKPTPGNQNVPLNQQQDFTCNNQVFDYRIPNKLTAFYNQQQNQQKQDSVAVSGGNKMVKLQLQQQSQFSNNPVFNEKPIILTQTSKHTSTARSDNKTEPSEQQTTSDYYYPNANIVQQGTNNANSKVSRGKSIYQSSSKQSTNLVHDQSFSFDPNTADEFLFQDDYEDLNYSYSDALNFDTDALTDSSPTKLYDNKQIDHEVVNDLSTNKNGKLHSCKLCSAQFSSDSDLAVHTQKHHSVSNNFSCSPCKLHFHEESLLVNHHKLVHEAKNSKAQERKVDAEEKPQQAMNMTIGKMLMKETEKRPRVQYGMNKSKAEIEKLREELAKEPFPFQCIRCAMKFAEREELVQHLEEHNEVKPFKCVYCNLGFTHMSAKKRHEKTHSNQKPHQCQQCPKAFFRKTELTLHSKTHTRDHYKFACVACAQMFKTEKKLKDHVCSAKMKDCKQLQCSLCDSILTSKMTWGVHMWKHTKDAAYILTSESDPWPSVLADKLPKDLTQVNLLSSHLDSLQPLNMQAVPS